MPGYLPIEGGASDFFIEVAKGNVQGSSLLGFVAFSTAITQEFSDVWAGVGDMVYPTTDETWEVLSDDATDTAGGTGATSVLVRSLDADLKEQVSVVALNGVTPVAIPGTHLRPVIAAAITAGSSGQNEGRITVRSTPGGLTRNVVLPGEGISRDGHFTVPRGKNAFLLQTFTLFPKDEDGVARVRFRAEGAGAAWIAGSSTPAYQNMVNFEIKSLRPFAAGTDMQFQASTLVGTSSATLITEFLIVDA